MAQKVKISTYEDEEIHFDRQLNNYTLCGLETGGDAGLNIGTAVITNRKVTCKHCISIVRFCKAIKSVEYQH